MKNHPKKFLNISTDKAAEPSTLYGATKNLAEHLASWGGKHIPKTKFASIRFGNVFESRGNVFEIWNEQSSMNKPLTITNYNMKRFFFKNIGKASLRQPSVQRHLPTLKPRMRTSTRPTLLTFLTFSGSFSRSGARSTPDALPILPIWSLQIR